MSSREIGRRGFIQSVAHGAPSTVVVGLAINTVVKPSRDVMLAVAGSSLCEDPRVRIRFFYGSPATTVENLVAFAKSGITGIIFCGFKRELMIDFFTSMPDHPPVVLALYAPLSDEDRRKLGRGVVLVLDNERIGRMAADYFIRHGLQHFAFLGSEIYREKLSGKIRSEAFIRQIREKGGLQGEVPCLMLGHSEPNDDFWNGDMRGRVEDWLKRLPLPCGVFVNGEIEAFALLRICRAMGRDVPGQIEVLCIDNSYGFCERASPTLSRIHIDYGDCGKMSMQNLLSLIRGDEVPLEMHYAGDQKTEIVERGSTASGRGYGRVAERAREFVRVHACEGIGVADVARHLGVSRRTMEKRVQEATGQSVLQMIRAVRLAEVCRLLETTDMTISEVTMQAGYQLTANLSVLFKKVYGVTMRQYRARHTRLPSPSRPQSLPQ